MNVFTAGDMKVAAVSIKSGVPAVVSLDGAPASVVVSGFGADLTVNAQFMRSLGSVIYVYPFGDNVGKVRVNFMAFMNPCGGAKGLGVMLSYYNSKKLSKTSSLVSVSIAGASFSGYLIGLSAQGDQADGIIPCVLDFAVVDSGGGSDSGSSSGDSAGTGSGTSTGVSTAPSFAQLSPGEAMGDASRDSGPLLQLPSIGRKFT